MWYTRLEIGLSIQDKKRLKIRHKMKLNKKEMNITKK